MENQPQHNIDEGIRFVVRYYKPNSFDSRKGWRRIQKHIAPERNVRKMQVFYSAAAAVALLLVVSVFYFTSSTGTKWVAKADNVSYVLPDSSRVEMQQGAQLKYDKSFGKSERRVSMLGEISFAVARNESLPFVVSTPGAEIQVLGTEFTVQADNAETRLSVVSGKVQFTPESPVIPLLCSAGMTVHYTSGTEIVKVVSSGSSMEINGKDSSLVFNNTQLKEVALVLSHFYNVPIELPGDESTLTFTSSFTQKNIIEIVDIINLTLDTHIKIEK